MEEHWYLTRAGKSLTFDSEDALKDYARERGLVVFRSRVNRFFYFVLDEGNKNES